jgi:hypothetical protein
VSSTDEILDVFYDDIERKSKLVRGKFGDLPFISGAEGMTVRHLYDLDEEDHDLLARIYYNMIQNGEG